MSGSFYEIAETSEKIFISSDFPDEYANSESRIALRGAAAKAKANASLGIPELIQIATNSEYSENKKKRAARLSHKTVRRKPISLIQSIDTVVEKVKETVSSL